ncbi:hypothetical protein CC78DRAFT_585197 [Lojkania enalia]|uniref:Uncharacterized protein n=1 Tax=Lojkania enalia TaxID=147567 RepID=A0A9P4K0T7_9PLEO|nr:hypothetical protein CC78DRAFT_585197 [Didymosphaeria enalia]
MKQLVTDGESAKQCGIKTEYKAGFTVSDGKMGQQDAVINPRQATCMPLQKLSVITEEYWTCRTAIRVPKGSEAAITNLVKTTPSHF